MSNITFTINRKRYKVDGTFEPDMSLNDYIRNVADLRGTKAMCHKGGCGACIVAVTAPMPPDYQMKTFAVNSCLVYVLSCEGWDITTVEGIGNRIIGYHDIQSRLAMFNGTQCGYCTPGWIMSMYSVYKSRNKKLPSIDIENSFASNLCRCTGYRPIADAFKTFATDADQSLLDKIVDLEDLAIVKPCGIKCTTTCLHKKCNLEVEEPNDFTFIMDNKMLEIEYKPKHNWYRPYTLNDVFKVMANGDYKLIAGNTGHGLYDQSDEYSPNIIDIFNVAEIKGYVLDVNLILGAGMPLTEMMQVFQALSAERDEFSYLTQFYDHMDLVAHIPVRNIGTIGGNLFLKHLNNDFQSDPFLLFETVGAMLTIAESATKSIMVTLPQFLSMNMNGRVIKNILLPPLSERCSVKTYKIMPRSQNALAVVNAGFLFKFRENTHILEKVNIVYGNISPTFIHAEKTEAALAGKDLFTEETLKLALESLEREIAPVEAPLEPSVRYRKMLAIALYYKAILYLCPDNLLNIKYKSGGTVTKRQTSKGTQSFETDKDVWPLNQPVPKIEAIAQCSGEATFANDLPAQVNEVFAAFVTADVIPGSTIIGFDTSNVMKIPGVIAFYSAKDIPGDNVFTPANFPVITEQEEVLCEKEVKFYGQPAGILVADSEKTAIRAGKLVTIKYDHISSNKPLISTEDVLASPYRDKRVKNDSNIEPNEAGNDVKTVVYGEMKMESQYHFYMETQTCVVKPTEDGMEVYSSTQWLDLTNVAIARCLKVPVNSVNVVVRRVGGSYGGKITRSAQIACSAALVSHCLGRTCRFVLPLETNLKVIGKRLATNCKFEVGVNTEGVIQYLKNDIYQNAGHTFNESNTMLTIKGSYNSYEHKRWKVQSNSVRTDTPSNTSCRAPFTMEGVAMIEHIMEKVAHSTGKDSLDVRLSNINKDHPIPEMIDQLKKDADFNARKRYVDIFNENNRWRKRALKIIPLSFGMMYTGIYNAIISIYHGDGTVVLIHGGIEMGQGLNTKAAQVCAYKLGVPLQKVSVKPSTSFTSPNATFTGGSYGSEAIAFAVLKACEILNNRLKPYKKDNRKWEEVISEAHKAEIDLQASYTFSAKNDGIQEYNVYAVSIMELELDVLTGNHDVLRVDILEDTGRSLNPEIDVAQIEGAFIMGLGYWTSEKLVYEKSTGKLLTKSVHDYRIPGIKDIPADMRIYFRRGARNEHGVLQSKATGEPALCLATIFTHAVRQAIRAARLEAGYEDNWVDIDNPCTVENIFMAVGHKLEHYKLK